VGGGAYRTLSRSSFGTTVEGRGYGPAYVPNERKVLKNSLGAEKKKERMQKKK